MIPLNTPLSVSWKKEIPAGAEAVVTFVVEGKEQEVGSQLEEADRAAVQRLLAAGAARGKLREVSAEIIEAGKGKYRRVVVAGLGKADKLTAESVRQAAAAALRALRRQRVARAAVLVPSLPSLPAYAAAEAIAVGLSLAAFDFEEYKGTGRPADAEPQLKRGIEVTIVGGGAQAPAVRSAVERGKILAEAQNFARTIASRPGNDINPPSLAKVAQEMARDAGLVCRVLDEKEMKKLGMGGILAVGAASIATPPRMIVLEYRGAGRAARGKTKPLLVVGKAITFDTGGISIKPAEKMGRMVFDKCGGMAVLGLMYALGKLRPAIEVVGILSSAENAISSRAYRPGDILRMYNGVTVEVTNTDAEGRLVLGDALAWGIETYQPAAVVDLATLTGGVVTALGKTMAGVMSNNDAIVQELIEAGDAEGEKIWRLPVGEEQRDYIRSDFADIVNSGGREGHPLQGAAFLSFFIPPDDTLPWAHLDIAGVADTEKELPCYAKGATGWGVRTLVRWAERRTQNAERRTQK